MRPNLPLFLSRCAPRVLPCLTVLTATLALALSACSDSSKSGGGATGGTVSAADAYVDPGIIGATDASHPGNGGTGGLEIPVGDAAVTPPPALDATPFIDLGGSEPECLDENCAAGQVCYQGACVDGTHCDANTPCAGGRICVDGVCIGDPTSAGGLVAEPDMLVFSYNQVGEPVRFNTTLTNRGADTLNITTLNVIGSPLFVVVDPPQLPLRLVAEQHVDIAIEFTADDLITENAVLQVVTDQPDATPVEVRLESNHKQTGTEVPCLQIQPNRADFGLVPRGNIGHRNVDLIGCGEAPVIVQRIDRGQSLLGPLSDHFGIDQQPALPLVIQPGQHVTLDLTYAPGRAGLEFGTWDIRSNDPATPTQQITVSAMAAAPPLENVGLHIRVQWNTDLTDVDTHVLAPGGQMWTCDGDCFFSNPNPNWGDQNSWQDDPFLDLDDVDGFGPENVNIQAPIPGTYRVLIHYWDTHGGDEPDVTVDVMTFNNNIGSYGPTHLNGVDDVWQVVDIDWPGPVVHELGGVQNEARGHLCGGL